ncbi:NEK, Kinase [Giardia lamblia P15]|uniref:non-specific serine/threonine protein kinase n=1 Tax=Giardia intestinalis (strain P15) TaxID=658858 RepID=E1F2N1_GIAIA|nr:NEK, Kinase [Giardia lamblia P15]
MDTASSESATVAPRVPTFTIRELYERLGGVFSEGTTGTVYSLKGCPGLAVKEIPLNGLDRGSVDNIKAKLTVIIALSYPGVLKYYQVIEHKGLIYVVMDRYDKTLEDFLIEHRRRKSPVSVAVILSIVRQVAAALSYLHDISGAGAGRPVHRDLRLANVLVGGDSEHFVIAGLGLCRDAMWSESTFAGTAAYMAPEVLLHNEVSPASDVWGLGVIVYELATLRRPGFLEGREPRDVFIDGWRPDLSGAADDLIKDVLERIFVLEPEKRLTARELHKMLTVPDIPVSELGAQYVKLKGECHSLETALNSANAKIALLEDERRPRRIGSLP